MDGPNAETAPELSRSPLLDWGGDGGDSEMYDDVAVSEEEYIAPQTNLNQKR